MWKRKDKLNHSLILLAMVLSCGHRNSIVSKNESDSPQVESASRQVDSLSRAEFEKFKKNFVKGDNGRIDSTIVLSLAYIKSLLRDSMDTTGDKTLNPVDLIENSTGRFFIIRRNCVAGAACAYYYLLFFDTSGNFMKAEDVGYLAVGDNPSVFFEYKVEHDTMLLAYKIRRDDDADTAIDTVVRRIKLSLK